MNQSVYLAKNALILLLIYVLEQLCPSGTYFSEKIRRKNTFRQRSQVNCNVRLLRSDMNPTVRCVTSRSRILERS